MHSHSSVLTNYSHNSLFKSIRKKERHFVNVVNYILHQNMVHSPILMKPTCFVFVVSVVHVRCLRTLQLWTALTNLNGKAENLYTHPAHIRSSNVAHELGKLVSVLEDLLHSQCPCKINTFQLMNNLTVENFKSRVETKSEREPNIQLINML